MKTAIITGVSGQDGSYLSKLLVEKNYRVIGLVRSYVNSNLSGLEYLGIKDKILIKECDLLNITQIIAIIQEYQPNEIYNLSAQSSVSISFKQPIETINYNLNSVLNLLEAIRLLDKSIKFYQASSSEIFGAANVLPIKESSTFQPISPYAISKASAHWVGVNYRDVYDMFVCNGILFNHESYLRSNNFFVKKVIQESIRISEGKQDVLRVGNIEIKRDFGYAPKFVESMYLMLQNSKADDFIICSGQSTSLKEIVLYIFNKFQIHSDKLVVEPNLYRPNEIENIFGDSTKAKQQLDWEHSYNFYNIVDMLIDEEIINWKK